MASSSELNDPLDLDKQIDFTPPDDRAWKCLCSFLYKAAFITHSSRHWDTLRELFSHQNLGRFLQDELSLESGQRLHKEDLYQAILKFYNKPPLSDLTLSDQMYGASLCRTIDATCSEVIGNSAVACFSKANDDFLMWSHYASGHSGICLEFEVEGTPENGYQFPFVSPEPIDGKILGWHESIQPVRYRNSLAMLPFFEFFPVFDEMGDVDLVNLSKSYWRSYADAVRDLFLEKLNPWQSEKEWRIVQVHFKSQNPEERTYNYPASALKGVYFGAKTTDVTRQRVRRALSARESPIFYRGIVDGSRNVRFHPDEEED